MGYRRVAEYLARRTFKHFVRLIADARLCDGYGNINGRSTEAFNTPN